MHVYTTTHTHTVNYHVCVCVCVCVCVAVIKMAVKGHDWLEETVLRHSATRWPRFSAGERRLRCEEHPQTQRDGSPSAAAATFVARPSQRTSQPSAPRNWFFIANTIPPPHPLGNLSWPSERLLRPFTATASALLADLERPFYGYVTSGHSTA